MSDSQPNLSHFTTMDCKHRIASRTKTPSQYIMRIISSSSFFCFSFYLVVTMVRRREGGTHDGFQEDVITTACRPLHSLYGVWGGRGRCGSCRVSFVTSLFVSSALCSCSGRPGNDGWLAVRVSAAFHKAGDQKWKGVRKGGLEASSACGLENLPRDRRKGRNGNMEGLSSSVYVKAQDK
jgi:hypothetical protein